MFSFILKNPLKRILDPDLGWFHQCSTSGRRPPSPWVRIRKKARTKPHHWSYFRARLELFAAQFVFYLTSYTCCALKWIHQEDGSIPEVHHQTN